MPIPGRDEETPKARSGSCNKSKCRGRSQDSGIMLDPCGYIGILQNKGVIYDSNYGGGLNKKLLIT